MAAGNSNNVGDAKTQTDFPADLRPEWLKPYNPTGAKPLPGDKMPNIAIVMSANEEGARSNYSNVIMTDNPQFLARGENILSGAMAYSMSTARSMIKARFPEIFSTNAFMSKLSENDSRVEFALDKMKVSVEEFDMLRSLVSEAISTTQSHLALKFNDQKAEISGTSMATPEVAFYTAKKFREKLEKADLWQEEAYGKPGFRPQDLIVELQADSKLTPVGTEKNAVHSLFEKQKYIEPSPQSKDLVKRLNGMRESNILCLRVYGKK
jgi:hypothetical protein